MLHGSFKRWSPNGQLWLEENYINGIKQWMEENYINGIKQ